MLARKLNWIFNSRFGFGIRIENLWKSLEFCFQNIFKKLFEFVESLGFCFKIFWLCLKIFWFCFKNSTRLWSGYIFQNTFLFVFHVNNIRARQNTWIWRTKPISIRKSITKPKPKLIKYPNYSKFWFLENRNRIRSEPKYSGYPNVSEIDLYTYIY